jgi:hypothetical protein
MAILRMSAPVYFQQCLYPRTVFSLALAKWVRFGGAAEDYRFAIDREKSIRYRSEFSSASRLPLESVTYHWFQFFCPDDRGCRAYKDGIVMYFDDNHLSVSGARQVVGHAGHCHLERRRRKHLASLSMQSHAKRHDSEGNKGAPGGWPTKIGSPEPFTQSVYVRRGTPLPLIEG